MPDERKTDLQHSGATPAQSAQADWYQWMDFFRTAAALIVVISHARDIVMADYDGRLIYAPIYAATGFGHSGVIVFFALSGFWISRSVMARLDSDHFWRDYLIDRLTRLLIVLVPALAIGGLLDWIGAVNFAFPLYFGASGSHSVVAPVLPQLRPEVLLGNLAFLQTILVPTWGSNGPLWSLAFEFWFYIWFPALALLVVKRRFSLALGGLAVAWFNPGIAFGFASWLAGFALLKLSPRAASMRMPPWQVAVGATIFLGVLLLSGVGSGGMIDLALALAFGGLLFVLRAGAVRLPRWLKPLASYGSNSSYSLYVVHFPLVALVGSWATAGVRQTASLQAVALIVALTVGSMAAAFVFSRLTERNTQKARTMLRRGLS
ncbi:MAG: acyltransferase family protein [Novosphingobium sp.]